MELLRGMGSVSSVLKRKADITQLLRGCVSDEYPESKSPAVMTRVGMLFLISCVRKSSPFLVTPFFVGISRMTWRHIAAGQKVRGTLSCQSTEIPTVTQSCSRGLAWEEELPGASCSALDSWCQQVGKEKFQSFVLISQGFYSSAYSTESLLIYTAEVWGKPNYSCLFGEII